MRGNWSKDEVVVVCEIWNNSLLMEWHHFRPKAVIDSESKTDNRTYAPGNDASTENLTAIGRLAKHNANRRRLIAYLYASNSDVDSSQ